MQQTDQRNDGSLQQGKQMRITHKKYGKGTVLEKVGELGYLVEFDTAPVVYSFRFDIMFCLKNELC